MEVSAANVELPQGDSESFILDQNDVNSLCDEVNEQVRLSDEKSLKTKDYILRAQRNWWNKNIEEKKYGCEKCGKYFKDSTMLKVHYKSKKHTGEPRVHNEKGNDYCCEVCDFKTRWKKSMEYHLNSDKHKRKAQSSS